MIHCIHILICPYLSTLKYDVHSHIATSMFSYLEDSNKIFRNSKEQLCFVVSISHIRQTIAPLAISSTYILTTLGGCDS